MFWNRDVITTKLQVLVSGNCQKDQSIVPSKSEADAINQRHTSG
jgi:hypothetical protein